MGCGLPLGDLFYLADSLLERGLNDGSAVASDVTFSAHRGPDGLRAQLYQMYGEGQISEEIFAALRTLAERGQLRPADLAVHRARGQHRLPDHGDSVTANALRGIRARLTQLASVRAASEKVMGDLDARLMEIAQRAADKEQAAREIIQRDEESARQRLVEKAELGLSRDRLATQAQSLRADLKRLEDLFAQLEAKSIELEAVQTRSRVNQEMLK